MLCNMMDFLLIVCLLHPCNYVVDEAGIIAHATVRGYLQNILQFMSSCDRKIIGVNTVGQAQFVPKQY